jgi:WD40 repeat protein/serine/threonine protein kinase
MRSDPERMLKLRELCDAALDLEPGERAAFLGAACEDDEELRREIESLLVYNVTDTDFLAEPAWKQFAERVATQGPSLEGRQLGRYRILSRLGAGGMGEVWRARDEQLKRVVAIKLLPPGFSADVERVRRFEQEAYTISALNHPNILTIHEVCQVTADLDDLHFIVTEFIEGRTLRDGLKQAPPRWREAVLIARQIVSALNAAHTAGIIHRDIKPENVMVESSGHVKVLDFGIARRVRLAAADSAVSEVSVAGIQTRLGDRPGTLKYMSPEQARGEQLDARTDIFSVGLVLYEMLAGRHPYARGNDEEILAALKSEHEVPRVTRVNDAIPAALDRIVTRALKKKREDRYASASEMLSELEQLQSLIEVSREERGQRLFKAQNANQLVTQYVVLYDADKKTRVPFGELWSIWRFADLKDGRLEKELIRKSLLGGLSKAGLQILLVAAVTMVVAAVMSINETWEERIPRDGHTAAVRRAVFSPDGRLLVSVGEDKQVIVWDFVRRQRLKTLTDHSGWVTSAAFSPDGKLFATTSHDKTVIVWDAERLEKIRVLGDHRAAVNAVSFSTDGRLLATGSADNDNRIILWDTLRWEKVREIANGSAYSPILFSLDNRTIITSHGQWDLDTAQRIAEVEVGNWVALSPDGKLMVAIKPNGEVFFHKLLRPGDAAGNRVLAHPRGHQDHGRAVVFSPDGKVVATGSENILLWDAATMEKLGRFECDSIVWGLAFSPDGRWLVSTHADGAVLVWNVTERKCEASLSAHSDAVRAVAYSPDGQRVASAGEDRSIIVWDAASGRKEAVLNGHQTRVIGVVFSPDGEWLVSSDQDAYLIRWDLGSGQSRWRIRSANPDNVCLAISPDGRFLAVRPGIYETDGGQPVLDRSSAEHIPALGHMESAAFSRDGRRLAFVAGNEVWVLEADGWRAVGSQQNGNVPLVSLSFSPDSRYLVTGSTDGTILLWEADPLRLIAKVGNHAARIKSLSFSPDGTLASSGDDKMIALWDLKGRELITRIGTHTSPVYAIAFSPDGRQLVSGEHDRSLRLYTRHRTLWGLRLN